VRYARLKQLDQNTTASPPKPAKWSVKDTTVNIANAFTLAAEDLDSTMQAAAADPNSSWASGSRTANPTNVPRSTSVEYEKETQSTSHRRFAPPPNRLAPPPSKSNGASRKPLSKQVSIRHVPDSEGEEDADHPPARNERGKSPFEHVVDMTKRAFAPATFYLRQRSQEPSAEGAATTNGHNGQNASYDYSAEEREFQSQQPTSSSRAHKKGRMSLDNKAYRPSASDLDDSDDDGDDDGRKVRRRKSKKKEPHGGPLTTLPTVAGHEKKRRRKKRGSKGNALDMDEDDSTGLSDEHPSEQVSPLTTTEIYC
jgi:SUN domain-containing protein 1/2